VAAALPLHERARLIQETLLLADAANSQMRKELATTYSRIAGLLIEQGQAVRAESILTRALELRKRLRSDDSTSKAYRISHAETLRQMGDLLRQRGRHIEARRHYRAQIDLLEPLSGAGDVTARSQLIEGYRALASIETNPAVASVYTSKASALARMLGSSTPSS
jgi:tetratricopeptide (TPR) repeat protein